MSSFPSIRLEAWSLIDRQPGDFLRLPERAVVCLHGRCFGHPDFPNGHVITTSPVKGRDGEFVVVESGKRYELGDATASYAVLVPNAKARLLAQLPQVHAAPLPSPASARVPEPATAGKGETC